MTNVSYVVGSELPDLAITWRDSDKSLIDFTSGWTFSLRIGPPGTVIEKTTGITGTATEPNITVAWAANDLDAIETGVHACQLWAKRSSDEKDRVLPFTLQVLPAIASA